MVRAKRENLIMLPVLLGLAFEFFFKPPGDWVVAFHYDTQARVALFTLTFALFWLAVPRSKRLIAFMSVLLGCAALNVAMLETNALALHVLRYDGAFSFTRVYRAVELVAVYMWAAGAKDNVTYLWHGAGHYGRCAVRITKRTLRWT